MNNLKNINLKKAFSIKGFSLIELSIVTVTVTVIGTLGLVQYNNFMKQQSVNRVHTALLTVHSAAQMYKSVYGNYPVVTCMTTNNSCSDLFKKFTPTFLKEPGDLIFTYVGWNPFPLGDSTIVRAYSFGINRNYKTAQQIYLTEPLSSDSPYINTGVGINHDFTIIHLNGWSDDAPLPEGW